MENLAKDKWIPVKKGVAKIMPKEDCDVWVTRTNSKRTWVQKIFYSAKSGIFQFDGIIAWMPYSAPEPYQSKRV